MNVKQGMKVVPHSKSVWSNINCIDSNNWRTAQEEKTALFVRSIL